MGELADRIDASSPYRDDPPPNRYWRLVLDLHADSWIDVTRCLDEIQRAASEHGGEGYASAYETTSGGAASGYQVELICTDDGEDYHLELNRWLERRKRVS